MIGNPRGEAALLRRYAHSRDPEALDELVGRLRSFARSLVSPVYRRFGDYEDLCQVAELGLVKAIQRYDPERGVSFKTFAVPTIRGELRRYLRDHRSAVRPPRHLHEAIVRNEAAIAELEPRLGREPKPAEIAGHIGRPEAEVLAALEARLRSRPVSLDQPIGDDGGAAITRGELVGDSDRGFETAELRELIVGAGLDRRRLEIIRMRFAEDLTQSEIGERIGVSQMQVSRLLRDSLAALREQLDPAA